jgi:hypothetical protein
MAPPASADMIRESLEGFHISGQRSAFSHQLNEQIPEDMTGDTVDHCSSESLNFLFLLKAES